MSSYFYANAQKFQHNSLLVCGSKGQPLKLLENTELIRGDKAVYSQMGSFQKDGTVLALDHLTDYIHCVISEVTEKFKTSLQEEGKMTIIYFNNEEFLQGEVVLYVSRHEAKNKISVIHNEKLYTFYVTDKAWGNFEFIKFQIKNTEDVKKLNN